MTHAFRGPSADAVSGATAEAEPSSKTILLVEDEDTVRTIASRLLGRSGFRVLPAAGPGEACSIFDEFRKEIDLLITDVVMPEMYGTLLAQRLVGISPDLPVLFMSGYNYVNAVELSGQPNSGFLSKPFTAAALTEAVNELLSRKR